VVPGIDMKSFLEKFIKYHSSSIINPMDLITKCISLAAANKNFPWECDLKLGDKVNYHSIVGGEITSRDHKIKIIDMEPNNFGCDVAWISNKSGCVSLEHLTLA
jgi:hypothetical protein